MLEAGRRGAAEKAVVLWGKDFANRTNGQRRTVELMKEKFISDRRRLKVFGPANISHPFSLLTHRLIGSLSEGPKDSFGGPFGDSILHR